MGRGVQAMADLYGRETVECCNCGTAWAMSSQLVAALRESHKTFYCPNGHGQSFTGKSAAQVLQDKLDAKQRELDAMTRWRDSWQADFHRSESTYRCVIAGCDHSNQTKAAMRKHMAREHDYAQKEPRALPANAGPDASNSDVCEART